jgi:hypothetical protein
MRDGKKLESLVSKANSLIDLVPSITPQFLPKFAFIQNIVCGADLVAVVAHTYFGFKEVDHLPKLRHMQFNRQTEKGQ